MTEEAESPSLKFDVPDISSETRLQDESVPTQGVDDPLARSTALSPSLHSSVEAALEQTSESVPVLSVPSVTPAAPWVGGTRLSALSLFFAVAITGVAADQLTKWWALRALPLGDLNPPSILGGWVSLRLTFNSGAAFSLGSKATVLFASFSVAVAVALIVYVIVRKGSTLIELLVLGSLLAGICGNLVDRLFREPSPMRGLVVDFISVRYFAIFNVADIFITCSAVGLVLLAWRSERAS
ncbi:MAG: signal peptidase II [Propionibacteriaceae bacterium]|nr:signal peptidase II [Propionibacteriaceae bacterium]